LRAAGHPTRRRRSDQKNTPIDLNRLEIQIVGKRNQWRATFRSEWVLVKNGSCLGTITHNAGSRPAVIKKVEVPAEVFDQCQACLRETSFFRMQAERTEVPVRDSSSSIKMKWNGQASGVGG
jgi:hypothetical protein